jgi:hypothetical protein
MLKRVTVFCGKEDDENWPPLKATDFIKWFSDKVSQIPAEYRESAKIGIYSFEQLEIDIYCDRPETQEEARIRLREEEAQKHCIEEQELETLRRLKEKYGE